jgi:O-antigen/teichoic acid export membrane protein
MSGGSWRAFRPAIWLVMLGIALALLIAPPAIGAVVIGFGVGLAARVQGARRRGLSRPRPRGRRRP